METGPETALKQRGQRTWTDAQRAEQARKIRAHQIWLKSTGPRTQRGKSISSHNSYKHGRYSFEKQVLRWYVRLAALRVKQCHAYLRHEDHKYQNELINRWNYHNPKKPNIMAFYPYFEVHPIQAYINKQKLAQERRQKPSEAQLVHDYFSSLSGED